MADTVNVHRIQVLSDLKLAFSRFTEQGEEALLTTEAEIRRTLEWLQGEISERRRTVDRRRQDLEHAKDALQDCLRSNEDDDTDCSHEIREVAIYRHRLEEAESDLEIAQRWKRKLEIATEEFRGCSARFKQLITGCASKGRAFLDQKLIDLERYRTVTAPSSVSTLSGSGSLSAIGGATASARVDSTGSPGISGHSAGTWVEKGIQDVEVSSLPEVNDIHGSPSFQKIELDEMKVGLNRIQEMLPVIKSGIGANKDYWRQVDQQRGLDYSSGYQRVYEAFYGQDAIRLEKNGNSYSITNGRHRIWLAKEMGIKTLPASVIERV